MFIGVFLSGNAFDLLRPLLKKKKLWMMVDVRLDQPERNSVVIVLFDSLWAILMSLIFMLLAQNLYSEAWALILTNLTSVWSTAECVRLQWYK